MFSADCIPENADTSLERRKQISGYGIRSMKSPTRQTEVQVFFRTIDGTYPRVAPIIPNSQAGTEVAMTEPGLVTVMNLVLIRAHQHHFQPPRISQRHGGMAKIGTGHEEQKTERVDAPDCGPAPDDC